MRWILKIHVIFLVFTSATSGTAAVFEVTSAASAASATTAVRGTAARAAALAVKAAAATTFRSSAAAGRTATAESTAILTRWAGGLAGTLHGGIGSAFAAIGRMNAPSTEAHVILAVVFVSADFKTHFHFLPRTEAVQQGDLVFDEFHFDVLRIAVIPGGDDKFTFREATAKRHDVHDDLDGPFDFVSHCDLF
ncbi:MAG: hypothetical protein JWL81_2114 [Verrucomicrobiales bacterium]|nr:hypothetical protein [Verrucomicrobiales bacterium]